MYLTPRWRPCKFQPITRHETTNHDTNNHEITNLETNKLQLESGSVLLPVLGICSILTVVTTGLFTVANIRTQIEENRKNASVAFYAAKGSALATLRQAESNQSISDSTLKVGAATVLTYVQSTQPWKIFITATVPGATDTISFSYDTLSRKLLSWQDNGPAP